MHQLGQWRIRTLLTQMRVKLLTLCISAKGIAAAHVQTLAV
jgi:hypothetical protein